MMIETARLGLPAALLAMAAGSHARPPRSAGAPHSPSFTVALPAATLKDAAEALLAGRGEARHLLGRLVGAVVGPASGGPLLAGKACKVPTVHEVDVISGGWTSVPEGAATSVVGGLSGLLSGLVRHEAEGASRNVLDTGAAPTCGAVTRSCIAVSARLLLFLPFLLFFLGGLRWA